MFLGLEFPQNIEGNSFLKFQKKKFIFVAGGRCVLFVAGVHKMFLNYISRQNWLYGHYSWYSVWGRGD